MNAAMVLKTVWAYSELSFKYKYSFLLCDRSDCRDLKYLVEDVFNHFYELNI